MLTAYNRGNLCIYFVENNFDIYNRCWATPISIYHIYFLKKKHQFLCHITLFYFLNINYRYLACKLCLEYHHKNECNTSNIYPVIQAFIWKIKVFWENGQTIIINEKNGIKHNKRIYFNTFYYNISIHYKRSKCMFTSTHNIRIGQHHMLVLLTFQEPAECACLPIGDSSLPCSQTLLKIVHLF